MDGNNVIGEKKGEIYYITLNRPKKRNAIRFEMMPDISLLAEEAVRDRDIRVIILRGAGKVFSAGVDFLSLADLAGHFFGEACAGQGAIRADIQKYQTYYTTLEEIELPVICAMHGAALGVGLELALACDIRLMTFDCEWNLAEAKFGVIPDLGGTSRLSKTIGAARAMEVIMTGKNFPADLALSWGLVNHLHPGKDALYEAADNLAQDIIQMGPIAVGAAKKVIRKGLTADMATQMDMEVSYQSAALMSEDFKEGVAALMEQRKPKWKRR